MPKKRRPRHRGSVRMRNGRVEAQIQIRGKRYSRTFSTPLDAEKWLEEMRQGKVTEKSGEQSLLFRELTEEFLESRKLRLKSRTYESYAYTLEHYVTPSLGEMPCTDITPSTLRKLLNQINDAVNTSRKKLGTSRTTTLVYRLLHMVFNFAREREWITENPMAAVQKLKRDPSSGMPLSPEQQRMLLRTIQTADPMIYSMVVVALLTGMRKGELLGLTWQYVNFEERSVYVCQQAQYIEGKMRLDTLKTKKSKRYIPLCEKGLQTLREQRERVEVWRQIARKWEEHDLVFPSSVGTVLSASSVSRRFKRFARQCGLENLRFHDLRHTFLTGLSKNGVDLIAVQQIAGHAHLKTTLDYLHGMGVYSPQVNKALDVLQGELSREK